MLKLNDIFETFLSNNNIFKPRIYIEKKRALQIQVLIKISYCHSWKNHKFNESSSPPSFLYSSFTKDNTGDICERNGKNSIYEYSTCFCNIILY